jgi:hypothetical protein
MMLIKYILSIFVLNKRHNEFKKNYTSPQISKDV